jgi:hypothetical protein
MRSDPEPDHVIVNLHADRTVIEIDPDGIHRLDLVGLLESETRVLGILFESLIGSASLCLDRRGKLSKGVSKASRRAGFHKRSGSSGCVCPARCSALASSLSRLSAS